MAGLHSDHRGSGEKPLLPSSPLLSHGPGGGGHGGYWPLAMGWEYTSFVQDLKEVEPNPGGISHQPGSTTLPWAGVWVEGPCVPQLIC